MKSNWDSWCLHLSSVNFLYFCVLISLCWYKQKFKKKHTIIKKIKKYEHDVSDHWYTTRVTSFVNMSRRNIAEMLEVCTAAILQTCVFQRPVPRWSWTARMRKLETWSTTATARNPASNRFLLCRDGIFSSFRTTLTSASRSLPSRMADNTLLRIHQLNCCASFWFQSLAWWLECNISFLFAEKRRTVWQCQLLCGHRRRSRLYLIMPRFFTNYLYNIRSLSD